MSKDFMAIMGAGTRIIPPYIRATSNYVEEGLRGEEHRVANPLYLKLRTDFPELNPYLSGTNPITPRVIAYATSDITDQIVSLEGNQRLEAALALCDRALQLTPSNPLLWLKKGNFMDKLGRPAKEYNESLAKSAYFYGLSATDPNSSQYYFTRALEYNPDFVEARLALAETELALKNDVRAISHFDKALSLEDLSPMLKARALSGKAMILYGKEDRDPSQALALCNEALLLDKTNVKALTTKAGCLAALENKHELEGVFDEIIAYSDDMLLIILVLSQKGILLAEVMELPQKAIGSFNKALSMIGRIEEELSSLGRTEKINSLKADVLYGKGRTLLALAQQTQMAPANAKASNPLIALFVNRFGINPEYIKIVDVVPSFDISLLKEALNCFIELLSIGHTDYTADAFDLVARLIQELPDENEQVRYCDRIALDNSIDLEIRLSALELAGFTLMSSHRFQEAVGFFTRAIVLQDENISARVSCAYAHLGIAFDRTERIETRMISAAEALRLSQETLLIEKVHSDSQVLATIYYTMAESMLVLNQKPEALKMFEQVFSLERAVPEEMRAVATRKSEILRISLSSLPKTSSYN